MRASGVVPGTRPSASRHSSAVRYVGTSSDTPQSHRQVLFVSKWPNIHGWMIWSGFRNSVDITDTGCSKYPPPDMSGFLPAPEPQRRPGVVAPIHLLGTEVPRSADRPVRAGKVKPREVPRVVDDIEHVPVVVWPRDFRREKVARESFVAPRQEGIPDTTGGLTPKQGFHRITFPTRMRSARRASLPPGECMHEVRQDAPEKPSVAFREDASTPHGISVSPRRAGRRAPSRLT